MKEKTKEASAEKVDFSHESLQDRESLVRYLEALSDGIKSGKLTLGHNGDTVVLHPNGLLKLDVKARTKDERIKLTFKISWKENGHGNHPIARNLTINQLEK